MLLIPPLCMVIALAAHAVHGFGMGAPDSTCGLGMAMVPGHGAPPQSPNSNPYTLSASTMTYSPGDTITLTLGGSAPFNGFLVQAEGSGALVGTMVAASGSKTLTCGGVANSGITHSSKTPKNSFQFQWTASGGVSGPVKFYVTFVQSYSVFWTRLDLLTLNPTAPPASPTASPTTGVTAGTPLPQTSTVRSTASPSITIPTTTSSSSSQNGRIMYDNNCGMTKGCFVKCSGSDCDYMVTWYDLGTAIQFEIFGKPDGGVPNAWVAIGFSGDTKMGDDSVTECAVSNGALRVFNSYNIGYSNRRLATQIGLSNVQGSYVNGVLACTFTRAKSVPMIAEMFDLNQDWHIMYANGRVLQVPQWQLNMHSVSVLPPASAAQVDFQSMAVIGSTAKNKLVKAHGCLMIIAWVLFTGIGIIAARHYKSVWADKTIFDLKIWFQIHRASMVSTVVLNSIAFIIIFIEVKGYSEIPSIPGKEYLQSHPVLGIIVTLLCLANPIMAFFRPGGDHKRRPIFNWAHWAVGIVAYCLSAICICFGFKLGKASTPDYAVYIMIVYVLYVILFDVVFEVMEYMNKKAARAKVEGIEMSTKYGTDNGHIANGNNLTKETQRKTDKIKTMLLAIHVAFTGAFTLVLVLVVALH